MTVAVILILLLWLCVAVCALGAAFSARRWHRPDSRWHMRALAHQQRQPGDGSLF